MDVARREILWDGDSFQYHNGESPSVGLDGAVAVQVDSRRIQGNNYSLQCAVSMVIERANWMADSLDLIGDKKLMEIAMPASHDAGMAYAQPCVMGGRPCNAQTQNHTILDQLTRGCRYFDLRPVIQGSTMYTGHFSTALGITMGCLGQPMREVLEHVKIYFETGRDLVILKFSHYRDRDRNDSGFGDDQMRMLLDMVTTGSRAFSTTGRFPSPAVCNPSR